MHHANHQGWAGAIVVLLTAGCTNDAAPSLRGSTTRIDGRLVVAEAGAAQPPGDVDGASGSCPDPSLGTPGGFGFVGPTAQFVQLCRAGGCSASGGAFFDPSQVALDYGNFPFKAANGQPVGTYFFAVIAPGYEDGFADGAAGNLSDGFASAATGDLGHGDTTADRTLFVSADQRPAFFPTSHGSHAVSFPPSQFMAIHLAPFDTTPAHRYELAICPADANSRCDCAFEPFSVIPLPQQDAGTAKDAGHSEPHDAGRAPCATDSGAIVTTPPDASPHVGDAAPADSGNSHSDGGKGVDASAACSASP